MLSVLRTFAILFPVETRSTTAHFPFVPVESMNANMYFNALLRPAPPPTLDVLVKQQAPPHRQLEAIKVLKAQETMHKAAVWRHLHPDWIHKYNERRWRQELHPKSLPR